MYLAIATLMFMLQVAQSQRVKEVYPMFLVVITEGTGMSIGFDAKATTYQQKWDYPVAQWQWDFGDGTRSEIARPTHRYDSPGAYKVCVQAEGEEGKVKHCRLMEVKEDHHVEHIGAQVAYYKKNHTVYAVFDQAIGMGYMTIEYPVGTVWWEGPLDGGSFELNLNGAAPGTYIFRLRQPRMEADYFELVIPE